MGYKFFPLFFPVLGFTKLKSISPAVLPLDNSCFRIQELLAIEKKCMALCTGLLAVIGITML